VSRRGDLDGPRLTYGGPTGSPVRERRGVPTSTVVLLVVCALLLVLVVATVVRGRSAMSQVEPTATPVPSAASASPSPPVGGAPSETGASPGSGGPGAEEGTVVPAGASEAAARFVTAWLDPNPKTREPVLAEVASAGLAEQLRAVDPAKIPKVKPVGAPMPGVVAESAATLQQQLSDRSSVTMELVAEPDTPYGWVVYTVSPSAGG